MSLQLYLNLVIALELNVMKGRNRVLPQSVDHTVLSIVGRGMLFITIMSGGGLFIVCVEPLFHSGYVGPSTSSTSIITRFGKYFSLSLTERSKQCVIILQ